MNMWSIRMFVNQDRDAKSSLTFFENELICFLDRRIDTTLMSVLFQTKLEPGGD